MLSFEKRLEVSSFLYNTLKQFKENDIIGIKKDGKIQRYLIVCYGEEYELRSLDETNAVWGSEGETIEEMMQELIIDFIKGMCEDIINIS